jgi:hypothetical protein
LVLVKLAPKKKLVKTPPPEVKSGTVTPAEHIETNRVKDFDWVVWAQEMTNQGRATEALETMNRVRDAYGEYVSTLFTVTRDVVPKPRSLCCVVSLVAPYLHANSIDPYTAWYFSV